MSNQSREAFFGEYTKAGIKRAGVIEFTPEGPINAALREHREGLGLTQIQLAQLVDIPPFSISLFETLRYLPEPELAGKIVAVFAERTRELNPDITQEQIVKEEEIFPPYLELFIRSQSNGNYSRELSVSQIKKKDLEAAYQRRMDSAPPSIQMDPVREIEIAELQQEVKSVLNSLNPRAKQIIQHNFGFVIHIGGKNLAQSLGLPSAEIIKIQEFALRKLRRPSSSKRIRDFYFD